MSNHKVGKGGTAGPPYDISNITTFAGLAGECSELLALLQEAGQKQSNKKEEQICNFLFGGSYGLHLRDGENLPQSHWVIRFLQQRYRDPNGPLGIDKEGFIQALRVMPPATSLGSSSLQAMVF